MYGQFTGFHPYAVSLEEAVGITTIGASGPPISSMNLV